MAGKIPRLFTFGIYSYCEKARWALEWLGVPFVEVRWPPGPHRLLARRVGAKKTTVPILKSGDIVFQGSGKIMNWAEHEAVGSEASLVPRGDMDEAREIEKRADNVVGVQVRRHCYAEMICHHQHLVKPALFMNTAPFYRLLGNLMWPVTRRYIRDGYDATPESAPDSRARLECELDWLDKKLADGRRFMVGDRFSRVDIAVASLLAPIVRPVQVEAYRAMSFPPALAKDAARWNKRPLVRWVRNLYDAYRKPGANTPY